MKNHVKIKFYSVLDKGCINNSGIILTPPKYKNLHHSNNIGASYFYDESDAYSYFCELLCKTNNLNLTLVRVEDEFIQGTCDNRTVPAMVASLKIDEVALNEVIRLDTPSKELMLSMLDIIIPQINGNKDARVMAEGISKIRDFCEFIREHPFTLDILKNSSLFNHVKAFIHPAQYLCGNQPFAARKVTIYQLNRPNIHFMS